VFTKSVDIYDLVYSFKDYKTESSQIINLIDSRISSCKYLLDIGCGTAEHHKYLKAKYSIEGIDLNSDFISTAKEKNKDCFYYQANMLDFRLNKKFDAIICMFSSIGYLKSVEELSASIRNFVSHLNQNGIIIIEPWFTPDTWESGKKVILTAENEKIKVCRMNHSYIENGNSILNFHYMVNSENGVEYFNERHELKLFSKEEMLNAFKINNLHVEFEDGGLIGRGLYFGKKK
jgi:trans-aconitate methyltransferase